MASIIYGRNPVLEALEGDIKIESLLIQNGIDGSVKKIIGKAKTNGIRVKYADKRSLDRVMNDNELPQVNHQGVLAFIEMYQYVTVDDIISRAESAGEKPFVVILDGIEDPHNLGAIIRTSEAAGAHGIIIPVNRSASVNETVVKTSVGAVFHIPVARVTNIAKTMEKLKKTGLWIYGLDMDGTDYYKESLDGPIAVVVGSEGRGLSRLVKEKCDVILSIPMCGKVNSLNASNAGAVVIYEVRKQRNDS